MADRKRRTAYTRDEMDEILARALKSHASSAAGGVISHDELLVVAKEAGIDSGAVERAAAELDEDREWRASVAQSQLIRKHKFWRHFASYAIVNMCLTLLALWTYHGRLWSIPIILGWGIGLAFHALSAFLPRIESKEIWKERREKRARKERFKRNAEQLGNAFVEGANVMISEATKRVESMDTSRASNRDKARVRVREDHHDYSEFEDESWEDDEPQRGTRRR